MSDSNEKLSYEAASAIRLALSRVTSRQEPCVFGVAGPGLRLVDEHTRLRNMAEACLAMLRMAGEEDVLNLDPKLFFDPDLGKDGNRFLELLPYMLFERFSPKELVMRLAPEGLIPSAWFLPDALPEQREIAWAAGIDVHSLDENRWEYLAAVLESGDEAYMRRYLSGFSESDLVSLARFAFEGNVKWTDAARQALSEVGATLACFLDNVKPVRPEHLRMAALAEEALDSGEDTLRGFVLSFSDYMAAAKLPGPHLARFMTDESIPKEIKDRAKATLCDIRSQCGGTNGASYPFAVISSTSDVYPLRLIDALAGVKPSGNTEDDAGCAMAYAWSTGDYSVLDPFIKDVHVRDRAFYYLASMPLSGASLVSPGWEPYFDSEGFFGRTLKEVKANLFHETPATLRDRLFAKKRQVEAKELARLFDSERESALVSGFDLSEDPKFLRSGKEDV